MTAGCLALTLLWAAAATEPIELTPDNVAEYDYFFNAGVLDVGESRTEGVDPVADKVDAFLQAIGGKECRIGPPDRVLVYVRFAPKRKGEFALGFGDLQALTGVSLVVREGDTTLSLPLTTEPDPGNYVHLHARFFVQRVLLPKLQLVFTEQIDGDERTFQADLIDFIEDQ